MRKVLKCSNEARLSWCRTQKAYLLIKSLIKKQYPDVQNRQSRKVSRKKAKTLRTLLEVEKQVELLLIDDVKVVRRCLYLQPLGVLLFKALLANDSNHEPGLSNILIIG